MCVVLRVQKMIVRTSKMFKNMLYNILKNLVVSKKNSNFAPCFVPYRNTCVCEHRDY